MSERFNPVDILLFGKALLLATRAHRVRDLPVPDVVNDLSQRGGWSPAYSVERLSIAADRATGRWARWFGGLDTCLVRSLVLGALLAERGDVVLNIGFREGSDPEPALSGHAWVTLSGQAVGRDGRQAETRYTRVLEIPFMESAQDV